MVTLKFKRPMTRPVTNFLPLMAVVDRAQANRLELYHSQEGHLSLDQELHVDNLKTSGTMTAFAGNLNDDP